MTDVGKVHADLVRAAGFEHEPQQRDRPGVGVERVEHLVVRHGVASALAPGHR